MSPTCGRSDDCSWCVNLGADQENIEDGVANSINISPNQGAPIICLYEIEEQTGGQRMRPSKSEIRYLLIADDCALSVHGLEDIPEVYSPRHDYLICVMTHNQ